MQGEFKQVLKRGSAELGLMTESLTSDVGYETNLAGADQGLRDLKDR